MGRKKRDLKDDFIVSGFLFHMSQIYIYQFALILLVSALFFALKVGITPILLPICFIGSAILLYIFYDREIGICFLLEIVAAFIILMLAIIFSGIIYDNTWDGNTYHKLGVGMMRYGWNPLYELPEGEVAARIIRTDQLFDISLWTEAYTKGTETFGAAVYAITGNIECGKAYTLLVMFCGFSVTCYILRKIGKTRVMSLLFSIAVAIHPLAVQQIDSFYVDGFLHIMVVGMIFSLVMYMDPTNVFDRKIAWSMVLGTVIICSNVKFTGLLFSACFCFANFLYKSVCNWKKAQKEQILKDMLMFGCIAMIAVFWAGSTSYVTNLIRHKTIGYPLTGKDPVSFESSISPFAGKNHVSNLLVSIYSEMDNFNYASGREPELKLPMTYRSTPERDALFRAVDIVLSGFGPYFSAVFTIALISIAFWVCTNKFKENLIIFVNLFTCIVLCAMISESWLAKYSPHVYIIALIGFYLVLDSLKQPARAMAGGIITAIYLVNSLVFLKYIPEEIVQSKEIKCTIAGMSEYDRVVFDYTDIGAYPGICFNLIDEEVDYRVDLGLNEAGQGTRLHELYPYFYMTSWMPEQDDKK